METNIAHILKHAQLHVTENRTKILDLFIGTQSALSHADIENKLGKHFDRVTIYRTLQIFVEKGIIHTIPTIDNSISYALCKNDCSAGRHYDNHVHFICDKCSTTYCLENITIPAVELPEGFTENQINVLVSGICKNCN
jgi:Fur family ferric uptake transcriptional regulator